MNCVLKEFDILVIPKRPSIETKVVGERHWSAVMKEISFMQVEGGVFSFPESLFTEYFQEDDSV